MLTLAFLGATSQIAKDLVRILAPDGRYSLVLFSRRPEELRQWRERELILGEIVSQPYEQFGGGNFDAIINCIGSGDPARTAALGGSILELTYEFDSLALGYLRQHPDCRYLFLSSGAAYGSIFEAPVDFDSNAQFRINSLLPHDFYSMAKIHAECRHRALPDLAIVDLRIFSYCSARTDMSSRFFTSDILRSIFKGESLQVSSASMHRDFITPRDLSALVGCVLDAPADNRALDVYSRAPVEKFELLDHLSTVFDFRYDTITSPNVIQSTGAKPKYYSNNRGAQEFGYQPIYSSIEGVTKETLAGLKLLGRY